MVKIGHAVANELGKAIGGKPGDQTGKEVRIQNWYDGKWKKVLRPVNSDVAEMIASNMEKICNNNNFGYAQDQRLTGYAEALKANFRIEKVTNACAVDCSSAVALCCIASGIDISPTIYTGNMVAKMMATGMFEELPDDDSKLSILTSPDLLKRGDTLWKPGHTAIVLSTGEKVAGALYYPKYSGSQGLQDAIYSLGYDGSYSFRKKIAKANGMSGYSGSAEQNEHMMKLLKAGKLKRV